MAKKIILFLSDLKPNAASKTYLCPDGSKVTGTQTNEATVSYLLLTNPDIEEILCLVTAQAKETAWAQFTETISGVNQNVAITEIPYETSEHFEGEVLTRLLSHIRVSREDKDEIFLDTTGGLRSTVIQLLLLTQALQYTGVSFSAYYCDYQQQKITDTTEQYHSFELLNGLQELTRYGDATTLRAYFGSNCDPAVEEFLCAMDDLSNSISLSMVVGLKQKIKHFREALEGVKTCNDPIMRAFYPICNEKFRKKLNNTRGVVAWCLDNGNLQQALTIYVEWMPEYFMVTRPDILGVDNTVECPTKQPFEPTHKVLLLRDFLCLSKKTGTCIEKSKAEEETIEHLEKYVPGSGYTVKCGYGPMKVMLRDYLYVRMLRNRSNHAGAADAEGTAMNEYLKRHGYPSIKTMDASTTIKLLRTCLNHLSSNNWEELSE